MIVDGEKYACEACIRGHRVSSCTHKDRKLNHVNKKGRPLTQCTHCRGLRRARSTHVKCDCGEAGHIRTRSVESNGDSPCRCQSGKRCTCALKKEPLDLNDVQRAHVTATASRRFASKPVLPGHHSDSAVPRIRAPIPPTHRLHNISHNHSQPYALPRPRPLTETLRMGQTSLHGFENIGSLPTIQQWSSQPAAGPGGQRPLSSSANGNYSSPPPSRRPKFPALRLDSQMSIRDFSGTVDISTMHKAISPGNPARYSFHDLSGFTLSGLSRQQTPDLNQYAAIDELRNVSSSNWQTMNMRTTMDELPNQVHPNPITPSDVSVDYSLSSQVGVSSSGTISEPGDTTAQPNDFVSQDLPLRTVPLNAGDSIQYEINVKPNIVAQSWAQYYSDYAASDPGAPFDLQDHVDNIGFNTGDLHGPGTGPGPFISQDLEPFELSLPIMTDDAVRDWVSHPAQMQDPNFNFEMPRYHGIPSTEGSYGWI